MDANGSEAGAVAKCGSKTFQEYSAGTRNTRGAGPFTGFLPNPFSDTLPRTTSDPCPGRAIWNADLGAKVCEQADAEAWVDAAMASVSEIAEYIAELQAAGNS